MEIKPWAAKIDGEGMLLFRSHPDREKYFNEHPGTDIRKLGMLVIALFWQKSEQDYLAASRIDDADEETWTRAFGQLELLTWMGGVALGKDRLHILNLANREHGTFASNYGWHPDVIIEEEPSP